MSALNGVRIIEFGGIGPGPFCGMMLADHGAEVIRIDRTGAHVEQKDPLLRSRRHISFNLKDPKAAEIILKMVETADGIIEGFRPGVMERLGLGPDVLLERNPSLVYGRMTGWGQFGSYAQAAGHDINYIALSGALHQCGRAGEKPTPPVNFLGDFGGGGMMLAFGMVSALLAVKNGSKGQVIDCAMTDGSALLTAMNWGFKAMGQWQDKAGVNLLDTGAHFYDTYETADGKYVSIGSIEPQFYALLLEKCGLTEDEDFKNQHDFRNWNALKDKLTSLFKTKTRDEWDALMAETDVCYAPILSMDEAVLHPHNVERGTYINVEGVTQPAPAPLLKGTPAAKPNAPKKAGADTNDILGDLGLSADDISALKQSGAVG